MMIKNKDISAIGIKEKYIRKGHYNTMKVWWARRPIMAMRALILNELARKKRIEVPLQELAYDLNPHKLVFKKFAESYGTENIKLLDVFSGGGSIPLESARLGLQTYAAELNPIASLLQETIFNSLSITDYPLILNEVGHEIISRAEARLLPLFTLGEISSYVIFWGRTAQCKECSSPLSLGRLKFLAKKKNKTIVLQKVDDEYVLTSSEEETKRLTKTFVCKHCETHHSFADIKAYCVDNKLGEEPLAICYHKNGKKSYLPVDANLRADILGKSSLVDQELERLSHLVPDEDVLTKSGVVNPTLYDLKTPADFFNKRQLACLLVVSDEIIKKWKPLRKKYGKRTAKQIVLGLTSLIEFLVDWNSKSTMWIPQNEQTGRSLVGPGVGMKWDYIEINPFYASGSNLRSKIDRVAHTFSQIQINNDVNIINGSSMKLPLEDGSIDLVVTDPPYYDSVDYTALSEFFRPWFEMIIKATYDKKASLKNDTSEEAIVALSKEGKKLKTGQHYQNIMTGVLIEVARVLKKDGACLLLYSHKTLEGWEVISEAFKSANLLVDHFDALNMERIARPRAMSYQALNGVVVFRLIKKKDNNGKVSSNLDIKSLIDRGDLEESNLPIYLAASACKTYCLQTEMTFQECYGQTVAEYEKYRAKDSDNLDELSGSYLKAFIIEELDSLDSNTLMILKKNNLLTKDNDLKPVSEINLDDLNGDSSAFSNIVSLFLSNRYNSTTQISLDDEMKDVVVQFCSTIGGHSLNTVRDRSSAEEQKIARLILSKIC